MANNLEIIERSLKDFIEIQKIMGLAKKENAPETYAELKEKYLYLKALLQTAGVNLSEIDRIKE